MFPCVFLKLIVTDPHTIICLNIPHVLGVSRSHFHVGYTALWVNAASLTSLLFWDPNWTSGPDGDPLVSWKRKWKRGRATKDLPEDLLRNRSLTDPCYFTGQSDSGGRAWSHQGREERASPEKEEVIWRIIQSSDHSACAPTELRQNPCILREHWISNHCSWCSFFFFFLQSVFFPSPLLSFLS